MKKHPSSDEVNQEIVILILPQRYPFTPIDLNPPMVKPFRLIYLAKEWGGGGAGFRIPVDYTFFSHEKTFKWLKMN